MAYFRANGSCSENNSLERCLIENVNQYNTDINLELIKHRLNNLFFADFSSNLADIYYKSKT